MHTRKYGRTVFNYNQDLSGEVIISDSKTGTEAKVKGKTLLEFVAEWVRDERVSALESQEDAAVILGIPKMPGD